MSSTPAITGLPELISRLNRLGAGGVRLANASINVVADMIVADAKMNAPADLGTIRQNIGKELITDGTKTSARVFSAAPESPFQEFGTGGRVVIPADMADVAAQYKGAKGGDFAAFILALTAWVKRKGINPIGTYQVATRTKITRGVKKDIDEQTAYGIARAILKKGLKPQPFLYPAFVKNIGKLEPMLRTAFSEYMRSPQSYF